MTKTTTTKTVAAAKDRFMLTTQDVKRVLRAVEGLGGVVVWDPAPHINEAVQWVLDNDR